MEKCNLEWSEPLQEATPCHDSSSKCWCHGPSQCAYERHYPPGRRPFLIFSGGECLSNVHWLGPWRQHFDDELRLCQNHRKNQEVRLLCSLFCGLRGTILTFYISLSWHIFPLHLTQSVAEPGWYLEIHCDFPNALPYAEENQLIRLLVSYILSCWLFCSKHYKIDHLFSKHNRTHNIKFLKKFTLTFNRPRWIAQYLFCNTKFRKLYQTVNHVFLFIAHWEAACTLTISLMSKIV
jgi:hypothetical protein